MLKGKVAIVTGASRGIGAETAKLFALRGAKVVVNYVNNVAAAEEIVADINEKGGEATAIKADVRNKEQMNKLMEETISKYEKIDILVNNAKMNFVMKPFEMMEWEEFIQKTTDELQAGFVSTKAVLPYMKRQNYGRIVFVSDGLSKFPGPGFIAHGTSKGAINSFVKYVAQEFGKYGITANIVSPGMVDTESITFIPDEHKQQYADSLPLGRVAQPEDIAKAIVFYASDDSVYVTGSYMPVSGGGEMN